MRMTMMCVRVENKILYYCKVPRYRFLFIFSLWPVRFPEINFPVSSLGMWVKLSTLLKTYGKKVQVYFHINSPCTVHKLLHSPSAPWRGTWFRISNVIPEIRWKGIWEYISSLQELLTKVPYLQFLRKLGVLGGWDHLEPNLPLFCSLRFE